MRRSAPNRAHSGCVRLPLPGALGWRRSSIRLLPFEQVGSTGWRSHTGSRQRETRRGQYIVTSILIPRRRVPSPSLSRAARRSERSSHRLFQGQRAGSSAGGGIPQVGRSRASAERAAGGAAPSGCGPSSVRVRQTGGTGPALVRERPCGRVHRDPTCARGAARPLPPPDGQPESRTASPRLSKAGV